MHGMCDEHHHQAAPHALPLYCPWFPIMQGKLATHGKRSVSACYLLKAAGRRQQKPNNLLCTWSNPICSGRWRQVICGGLWCQPSSKDPSQELILSSCTTSMYTCPDAMGPCALSKYFLHDSGSRTIFECNIMQAELINLSQLQFLRFFI